MDNLDFDVCSTWTTTNRL